MPNTSKSSKKAAPAAAAKKAEFVDTVTPLVLSSVERVAELQKKTLDLAAEQTAEFITAWKKAFSYSPVTPPAFIFDVASQAVQTAIDTQKGAIDLVVEQTKSVADIAKVRVDAYSQIVDGVTATVKKSVERTVEAQKKVLEFASEQNSAAFVAARKQLGAAAEPASVIVDTFQRGAEAVIEAQKSILNIAAQPFTASKN
jgi:hypothetical protein